VLHQVLAPYCMAAEFGLRLQSEMLAQWLDAWSGLITAAVGGRANQVRAAGGRERRPGDNAGPGGGPHEGAARPPGPASRKAEDPLQVVAVRTAEKVYVTDRDAEEAQILRRAYLKWLGEGRTEGQHLRH
jgi:hypothetical protein